MLHHYHSRTIGIWHSGSSVNNSFIDIFSAKWQERYFSFHAHERENMLVQHDDPILFNNVTNQHIRCETQELTFHCCLNIDQYF